MWRVPVEVSRGAENRRTNEENKPKGRDKNTKHKGKLVN
jgi:hypothetical protein